MSLDTGHTETLAQVRRTIRPRGHLSLNQPAAPLLGPQIWYNSGPQVGKVAEGVLQCSVLGPTIFTLFNIVLNDLSIMLDKDCTGVSHGLLADDSAIWKDDGKLDRLKAFLHVLDKIHAWSIEWGFRFSEDKTVAVQMVQFAPNRFTLL